MTKQDDYYTPREWAYSRMIAALHAEYVELINNNPHGLIKKHQIVALRAIAAEHNRLLEKSRMDGLAITPP